MQMENVSNNKVLCLNNEADIPRKKEVILDLLEKGVDVLAIFDLETTGLNKYPKIEAGKWRDRILEVGFIMYYRDGADGELKPLLLDDKPITFQEYVNPFRESEQQRKRAEGTKFTDPEAFEIHKITNNFLYGKESFNGIKLHKPAPTFAEVKPFMEDFLCLNEMAGLEGTMHFVAHNGKGFDAIMLTEEMYLVDKFNPQIKTKRTFESLVPSLIDTKIIMKDLFDKQDLRDYKTARPTELETGNTMSYLAHVVNVKETGRENFHGALLDSLILKNVLNALFKNEKWINATNKIEIKQLNPVKKNKTILPIESLSNENVEDGAVTDILTVIKTDASFKEGTGTITEYVEAAKELGLKSLTMADVVSVSRFVEFYESCKKAEIKPIIGTMFKVESFNDIYNHVNKNKETGATESLFKIMSSLLKQATGKDFNTIEEIIEEYNLPIIKFQKAANSIVELNKKIYSPQKTSKAAMLKLVEKVAKDIYLVTGEKYTKEIKEKINLDDLKEVVFGETTLIKFKEFTRADGYSDLLLVADNDEGFDTIKKLITS